MSRLRPAEAGQRELEMACNRCGANPGQWCVIVNSPGRWTELLRRLRFYSALRAGRLPLEVRGSVR